MIDKKLKDAMSLLNHASRRDGLLDKSVGRNCMELRIEKGYASMEALTPSRHIRMLSQKRSPREEELSCYLTHKEWSISPLRFLKVLT